MSNRAMLWLVCVVGAIILMLVALLWFMGVRLVTFFVIVSATLLFAVLANAFFQHFHVRRLKKIRRR